MKTSGRRATLALEALEDRALLSGFGQGAGGLFSSPAVQADLAKMQADWQKLQSDSAALAPTLQQDRLAIQAAIANSQAVQHAQATLNTDLATLRTTLQADWKAVLSTTDAATRNAALAKFRSDRAAGTSRIAADQTAIQTAITNDPDVQRAKAQLQADSATIVANQAVLNADLLQLRKDLQGLSKVRRDEPV